MCTCAAFNLSGTSCIGNISAAPRHGITATQPPVHMQVWRVGEQQHILLASLHHAIIDGWSVPILRRELSQAYAAALKGTQPGWRPLPVQVFAPGL